MKANKTYDVELVESPRDYLNRKAKSKGAVIEGFDLFSPEAKIIYTDSIGHKMTFRVKAEPISTWSYRINDLLDEYLITITK